MARYNKGHWAKRGNPKPKGKKHTPPATPLSSTDRAALLNMGANGSDAEVSYLNQVGVFNRISSPQTYDEDITHKGRWLPEWRKRLAWAQYPKRA